MPPFAAQDLLSVREVAAHPNKPRWANLVAHIHVDPVPRDLCGPGLYALFLDGALFYIGLHVGADADPGLPVLERWKLHVVGQTLRAKAISFSPTPLNQVLRGPDASGLADDLAACLPNGRDTDCHAATPHPLLGGSHCTAQKAAFASAHWDSLCSAAPDALLARITCLFRPLPAGWEALLDGAAGRERGDWAREQWLRPAETALVEQFRPICNACIPIGTHHPGLDAGEVSAALETIFPAALPPFDRAVYDARVSRRRPAPRALVEAYAAPGTVADDHVAELAEDEGLSRGELAFRQRLSPAGTILVDALLDACPAPLEPYFTNVPDLRIRLGEAGRTLMMLRTARGQLHCFSKAEVAAVAALGLAAEPVQNDPMRSRVTLDPAAATPALLLAIAQAAAEAVAD